MARLKYWVWFSALDLSPLRKAKLLECMESPETLFFMDPGGIESAFGKLSPTEKKQLGDKSLGGVNEILSRCDSEGYSVLTLQDADYPERLRSIPDAPAVLYIQGSLPELDELVALGIVGTRQATPYGYRMAYRLGSETAEAGALVVSGLAKGADSAAMEGALRAGGTVLGVLGTGIDRVYPAENRELFAQTAAQGALLSEYPPGARVYPTNFLHRNRIIAALSLGVIVTEAPVRSGALSTARCALEYNRDVYAVPGNADAPACAGCLALLRDGAEPITEVGSVVERYSGVYGLLPKRSEPVFGENLAKKGIDKPKSVPYIDIMEKMEGLPPEQKAVAQALTEPTMSVDELVLKTGLSVGTVNAALTMLQMAGLVKQVAGRRYSLG